MKVKTWQRVESVNINAIGGSRIKGNKFYVYVGFISVI